MPLISHAKPYGSEILWQYISEDPQSTTLLNTGIHGSLMLGIHLPHSRGKETLHPCLLLSSGKDQDQACSGCVPSISSLFFNMKQKPRMVEGLAEGFGLWELFLFCGTQGMSFLFCSLERIQGLILESRLALTSPCSPGWL